MSIYGHFTQQYYGNKIDFPVNSFLISGTSFYKNELLNITYETELKMKEEKDNKYDCNAICIMKDNSIIGYVPNKDTIKDICKDNINEKLKIINIKIINGNTGIRVIPNCFYEYDPILEKQILFCD